MANKLTFVDGNVSLKNITEYPNSFKRQGAFPLERFSVFGTKEALEAYATSNPVAYVGQILAWVDEASKTTTIYSIQDADGNLAQVGKATAGDDKSISLDSDSGVLSLKNWGKEYYHEVEKLVGDVKTTVWEAVTVDKTHPWVEGLVPKVAVGSDGNFELKWYVPSTKDVEDLTEHINTINGRLDGIDEDLANTVKLTGDQTIDGIKTFKVLPEVPTTTPTKNAQAASKKYVDDKDKAYDATNVHLTGDETIAGKKTFSSAPTITPAPATDTDAANKKYVDDTTKSAVSALGTVMTIAEVYETEKAFNDLAGAVPSKWSDESTPVAGDVALVKYTTTDGIDMTKEYVVVKNGESLRFEFLGDASGVTDLKQRMITAEGKITTLEGKMTTTEEDVTDLDQRMSTVEGKIPTLEETDTNLRTDLGTKTDASTKDTAFGRIKKAEEAIGTKEAGDTSTDSIYKRIKDVEGKAATNETNISNINSDIGNDDTASSIKGRIKAVEGKAATNETNISTINNKLKDIADGAQVNVIESVKVTGNGVDATATISDKVATVTLPDKVTNAKNADVAETANNTKGTLTIGTKTFNGNADITVDMDTLGIGIATGSKTGLVLSSSGTDHVSVDATGVMTISKASKAGTADKVANALKFGEKTYDGSTKDVEITLTDLGFNSANYATAEQGASADSAIQEVTVAGKKLTKETNTVTAAEIETALKLGSAAKKADTYFAKASDLTTLNDAVVKKTGAQDIDGVKTFKASPIVPTPTADTQAANKGYVDTTVASKIKAANAMRFMGLLNTGDTLPTTDVQNGDTYKVATAGTYNGQAAKVGDMFIALVSTNPEGAATINWQYIPSADDGNVSTVDSTALATGAVVVGANDGQAVKTLAAGTTGQILRQTESGAAWSAEEFTTVAKADDSITVSGTGHAYTIAVNEVNANKLVQTDGDYLIFDCGSSSALV